jgi:transposase-like protein
MLRIRYSSEIRETTVRRILDGQVSRTDAAREIGCSLNTIHVWLNKHQNPNVSEQQALSQTEEASFLPIPVSDANIMTLEIVMSSGIPLRLNGVTADFFAELVQRLQ